MLSTYTATRYIVPLKEGGSLPAILDTDGAGMFVAKFRGAGQGARALVAEIVVGRIAERLGLPVPELALIDLDDSFGRTERDPEIQDILKASVGTNVGLRYLEGAFTFDPVAIADIDRTLATEIVWLDALTTNIDRTPRNPNMMMQGGKLWLIDHGAALFFHHDWGNVDETRMKSPFAPIRSHVLMPFVEGVTSVDDRLSTLLSEEVLREIVDEIPDELLMDAPIGTEPPFASAAENRDAYIRYFTTRLEGSRAFASEIERASAALRSERPTEIRSRR